MWAELMPVICVPEGLFRPSEVIARLAAAGALNAAAVCVCVCD